MQFTTKTNHGKNSFDHAEQAQLARLTARAVVSALRETNTEAMHRAQRTGCEIDTSRLWAVSAGLPDPMPFARVNHGSDSRPSLGLTILCDASGSMMSVETMNGMSRLQIAAAMACGFVEAGESLALPVQVGHHGQHQQIELRAHRKSSEVIKQHPLNNNVDAYAVWAWLQRVEAPAKRNLFVLICDGAPCSDQRSMARECIALMHRRNTAFILAFVGRDAREVASAEKDWGARRVADCRTSPAQLTRAIVRGLQGLKGGA